MNAMYIFLMLAMGATAIFYCLKLVRLEEENERLQEELDKCKSHNEFPLYHCLKKEYQEKDYKPLPLNTVKITKEEAEKIWQNTEDLQVENKSQAVKMHNHKKKHKKK